MRKTLVIVTPGFPKDEADSTCMPDRQIFVRILKETYRDLNIVVLAFQYPYEACEYRWNGIKVIALGGKNKSGLYRRMTWLHAWRELKNIHSEYNIIGLLSFWLDECAFVADKFADKFKLKHYIWLLGQDARPGNKYVYRIMPNGDNLIALSDYLVNEFNKNYGVTAQYVVPGAIDTALFKPSSAERDIDILGVGSLIPLKQFELFIETVKFLKDYLPDIKAVICGKGPEMQALKDLAISYQLEKNITFKGELAHPEILEQMQRSKILLHPSKYEGFSTVLLEALYAGAHVVSFFKPMEAAFFHHHIVDNAEEMNSKVLELLNNTDRGHQPVLINEMTQMAESIMNLFDGPSYKKAAIS
jgi:glycosyltransferase involved in cell wall biosynthesis